jgi:heme exporter protein B
MNRNNAYFTLLKTELLTVYRYSSEVTTPLLFFVLICTLFPLAVSPEAETLRGMAPGVLWVAALLSTLLALEGLFRTDFDDGTLEQVLLSPNSDYFMILVKVLSRWIVTGLPLVIASPLLAIMLFLPADVIPTLICSLLLGTLALLLIGAFGAALILLVRNGGVLLSILVLPLYLPVLIFGSSAVYARMAGFSAQGELLWLAAILSLALVLSPVAIIGALRISLTNG